MCLDVSLFRFLLFQTFLGFLDLDVCFLPQVRQIFSKYFIKKKPKTNKNKNILSLSLSFLLLSFL